MLAAVRVVLVVILFASCYRGSDAILRKKSAKKSLKHATIPAVTDANDMLGNAINGATYTTKTGDVVYHASNVHIEQSELGVLPLWVSPRSTNALASGYKKARGELTYTPDGAVLYLHEIKVNAPFNLVNLRADAKANRQILIDNDLDVDAGGMSSGAPYYTMGNPSLLLPDVLKRSRFCTAKGTAGNCGWRSAWDQDELMICHSCQSMITIQTVYRCDLKAIEAIVKFTGAAKTVVSLSTDIYSTSDDKKQDDDEEHQMNQVLLKNKAKNNGGLLTFDMMLGGGVDLPPLIDQKACVVEPPAADSGCPGGCCSGCIML